MDPRNADDGASAPETTGFHDPAAAIISMYLTRVKKFDDENVENWKGGAKDTIVFVCFYSASITTILTNSLTLTF